MAKITDWPKDPTTGQYTKPVPPLPSFNAPMVDRNGVLTRPWAEYFFQQRAFIDFMRSKVIEIIEKVNPVLPP